MIRALWRIIFEITRTLIEGTLRFLWLALPLGVHVFFMQMRESVDTLPALGTYVSQNSTWSMIYDGVVLVNTNPGGLKKKFAAIKTWFIVRKTLWVVLAVLLVVALLTCILIKLY